LLGNPDNFAEQPVAAVHRRGRSQHDAGESTGATQPCENGQHFLFPGFRRRFVSRVSAVRRSRHQANKILIAQRGNQHASDAGFFERTKNGFHFVYAETRPRREMIDDRSNPSFEHFGTR